MSNICCYTYMTCILTYIKDLPNLAADVFLLTINTTTYPYFYTDSFGTTNKGGTKISNFFVFPK